MIRVTELLKKYGYIDESKYTPGSAEIGSKIHTQTELIENEMIYIDDPKAIQWAKFLKDYNAKVVEVEIRLDNGLVTGKIDRILQIGDELVIVDIKTSKNKQDWWGIQLWAYFDLATFNGYKINKIWNVRLTKKKYIVDDWTLDINSRYLWQDIIKKEFGRLL